MGADDTRRRKGLGLLRTFAQTSKWRAAAAFENDREQWGHVTCSCFRAIDCLSQRGIFLCLFEVFFSSPKLGPGDSLGMIGIISAERTRVARVSALVGARAAVRLGVMMPDTLRPTRRMWSPGMSCLCLRMLPLDAERSLLDLLPCWLLDRLATVP